MNKLQCTCRTYFNNALMHLRTISISWKFYLFFPQVIQCQGHSLGWGWQLAWRRGRKANKGSRPRLSSVVRQIRTSNELRIGFQCKGSCKGPWALRAVSDYNAKYNETLNAPINVMPAGGEAGHGVGIWLFSKIFNQIPWPRVNHSSQMQPNFPTPGCTLLAIPRQNLRKAQ